MSNDSPVRARGRIVLALCAFFLLACGSGPTAPAPAAGERAAPRFDGSSEEPAPPDTGSTTTDGNYHSPHV